MHRDSHIGRNRHLGECKAAFDMRCINKTSSGAPTKASTLFASKMKPMCALMAIVLLMLSFAGISTFSSDKVYASELVHYSCKEEIDYGQSGWFTHVMECDGSMAYCVQPNLKVPQNGNYRKGSLTQSNSSLENLRALLWFGYGGPGFDPSMWPSYYSDGSAMRDDLYYVLTHVILTNYYNASDSSSALRGFSASERNWISLNIMPFQDSTFGFGNGDSSTFVGRCFQERSKVSPAFECFSINSGNATQTILSFVAIGELDISKVSANHSISDFNPLYSLDGITYDVFSDSSCTYYIGSLTLNEHGTSDRLTVSQGKCFVKERADSIGASGYALDNSVHEMNIRAGSINTLRVSNPPQYAIPDILISKADGESMLSYPQGAASLEGAQFEATFYGGIFKDADEARRSGTLLKTWVFTSDPDGHVPFDKDHLVSGDSPYLNEDSQMVLPLGTLLIKEICAPLGYLLDDSIVYISTIEASGTDILIKDYHPAIHPDLVKRGDIEFLKAREADMSRLSNTAFRLTSETTKESHILVTDENGYFCSKADWNPHTHDTNVNDDRQEGEWSTESGLWFGALKNGGWLEPDDGRAALPYDTYTLTELRCSANADTELIEIEHISIKRDNTCIDLGTIDDPVKQTQYIISRAFDAQDLDKTFAKGAQVKLIDSIDFSNLIPNDRYTLKTELVYRDTGEVVRSSGEPIRAEKSFIASSSNGKTNVELSFDTTDLDHNSVVFYERLYKGDVLIAEDCDLKNPDQTLFLQEPWLKTYATDAADGDKSVSGDRNACIVDAISYSNLIPGENYDLRGELLILQKDETDNDIKAIPILDNDGNPVTSGMNFIADGASGQVELSIPFDGFLVDDGSRIVVFERLYKDGVLICEHCDMQDEDQIVEILHPMINSFAHDSKSGSKSSPIDESILIQDRVTYENLTPGETYELIGVLLDPKSDLPFSIDVDLTNEKPKSTEMPDASPLQEQTVPEEGTDTIGSIDLLPEALRNAPFISRSKFTAESSSGEEKVEFEVNIIDPARISLPQNIVVYEYLIHNDEVIAKHEESSDLDQTVVLTEPRIFTEAIDKTDGDHVLAAIDGRCVVDTVYYENLVPGKEYLLKGILMDKSTGKTLSVGGRTVEGKTLFSPNAPCGHTEVEFEIDCKDLEDNKIVVFEELYKDDTLITKHADIDNAEQSLSISDAKGTPLPQTGDDDERLKAICATITILSMIAFVLILRARKRRASFCPMSERRTGSRNYSKHDRLMDSLLSGDH